MVNSIVSFLVQVVMFRTYFLGELVSVASSGNKLEETYLLTFESVEIKSYSIT